MNKEALLDHLLEKHGNGVEVQVFLPTGQMSGELFRGPVDGIYCLKSIGQGVNAQTGQPTSKPQPIEVFFGAENVLVVIRSLAEEQPRIYAGNA